MAEHGSPTSKPTSTPNDGKTYQPIAGQQHLPPPPFRQPYPDYDEAQARRSPWKYEGYRLYSKWVASENTFFIVRRFGALNTRIILALQDEIVQLEHRLNRMDEENSRKQLPDDTNNGSFRYDLFDERRDLVQNVLPEKLARYSTCGHTSEV